MACGILSSDVSSSCGIGSSDVSSNEESDPVEELNKLLSKLDSRKKSDKQQKGKEKRKKPKVSCIAALIEKTTKNYCPFKYLIVMDFEATCLEKKKERHVFEIIEFPAVVVEVKDLLIVDYFHSYVRPIVNPVLSDFCKDLTGIQQEKVDKAQTFDNVFRNFMKWLNPYLGAEGKCMFVFDGKTDAEIFLPTSFIIYHLYIPNFLKRFIDVKKVFCKHYGIRKRQHKLLSMLEQVGLKFEGNLHCGRDDAYNIARLVIYLLKDGAEMTSVENVTPDKLAELQTYIPSYMKEKGIHYNKRRLARPKPSLEEIPQSYLGDVDPDIDNAEVILKSKLKNLLFI